MNLLVFDIETIPDVAGGRRLLGVPAAMADSEVAEAMFHARRQASGSDFLRLHLQRVVAISVVLQCGQDLRIWSLGDPAADESDLIQRFFDGIERFTPTLVSWNGSGFDLPVLHYRALRHSIRAPRYWESGDHDNSFRYNNYLNRYHYRHLDLMDILASYNLRAAAPLDEMATLLGFPGKLGMSGAKVWERYQAGDIDAIRHYCEHDVLNTYLIYLRFELFRGHIDDHHYQQACAHLRAVLQASNQPHFNDFLAAWPAGEGAVNAAPEEPADGA